MSGEQPTRGAITRWQSHRWIQEGLFSFELNTESKTHLGVEWCTLIVLAAPEGWPLGTVCGQKDMHIKTESFLVFYSFCADKENPLWGSKSGRVPPGTPNSSSKIFKRTQVVAPQLPAAISTVFIIATEAGLWTFLWIFTYKYISHYKQGNRSNNT